MHKKEYMTVDCFKFQVQCTKCIENGDKHKNLEVTTMVISSEADDDQDDVECNTHSDVKGDFYCDDCQVFLCKLCFVNDHRTHKSNLPKDIATTYKLKLQNMVEDISIVKPRIEESLKIMSEIDKKIKTIREITINRMKEISSKINSIIKSKYEKVISQFEATFGGMDIEVDTVYNRLESLLKKSIKHINDINEIKNYMNNPLYMSNSYDVCLYKKSKSSVIKDVNKMLEDAKNFLQYKIEYIKIKANKKLEEFHKQTEKFFKQLQIYEKSAINSVNTGISSSSLRLRRYGAFSKKNYAYYKTSSVLCKVNSSICLVGLSICGLYQSSKDHYITEVKTSSAPKSNSKIVPIQIEVSEIKADNSKPKESLIKEKHYLSLILNHSDPTIVIYLNKAIIMKPEMKYIITITNLHKDSYLEIWCGRVASEFLKEMVQYVYCNTSGISFEFYPAQGVESDFNEFNSGIVADLIYAMVS